MDLSAPYPAPVSAAPRVREGHDANVDLLRGLAALAVALYHFSRSDYLGTGLIATALHHGYLGVHVFFVVSGYVIPLALARMSARAHAPFELKRIPRFLIGRWIRLYPAFAVSAALSIALWYASALVPGFRGGPPSFSLAQIAANATLSCDLFNLAWFNPVFWTLAIEAQYYLLAVLFFPLLIAPRKWIRFGVLSIWIAAPLLSQTHGTLFPFGATFALGFILYASRSELLTRRETTFFALAALAVSVVRGDYAVAVTSGFSFVFLATCPAIKARWMLWLGSISYSLYLLHVPIGGRVINLSQHFDLGFAGRLIAVASALAASIAASILFFRYIEAPSHQASRRWMRRI